jgi:hypothetical protein
LIAKLSGYLNFASSHKATIRQTSVSLQGSISKYFPHQEVALTIREQRIG